MARRGKFITFAKSFRKKSGALDLKAAGRAWRSGSGKNPAWARKGASKGKRSKVAWKRALIGGMRRAGRLNPAWKRVGAKKGRKSKATWRARYKAGMAKRGVSINPPWAYVGYTTRKRPKRRMTKRSRLAWRRRTLAGVRRATGSRKVRRRRVASTSSGTKRRKNAMTRRKRRTTRRKTRRVSRRRNPIRRRKTAKRRVTRRRVTRRRSARRRNPLASLMGLAANPRRKRRKSRSKSRRRNPIRRRRSTRRRRNPLAIKSTFKGLISKSALKQYGWVAGGLVAGGVVPTLLERALDRAGVSTGGTAMRVGLGLGAAVLTGIGVKMATGSSEKAQLAAAGAVAGVLGALILKQIETYMPGSVVSGFGAADDDVRRAIEQQVKKELGVDGVGAYVTQEELMGGGVGEYITPIDTVEAPAAAGMGLETAEDIDEVDTFDGVDF